MSKTIFFPKIPVRVEVDVLPREWTTFVTRDDEVWFKGGKRGELHTHYLVEAQEMRIAFFAAKTAEQALEFLNKYNCTWENPFPDDDEFYSYPDFCGAQRVMRRIVDSPTENDMFDVPDDCPEYMGSQLQRAPEFGFNGIWNSPEISLRYPEPNSLLSALSMLSWIERLQQIRYGFCLRCDELFPKKTRHRKEYCSYACAHLVQVKKSQEKKRQVSKQKP